MGATLRVTLLFVDSATSTALSAGHALSSLARPFWCTGKRGLVHCRWVRPGPPVLPRIQAESHRELRGSSLSRFGSVSSWPESIRDKAALARSVSSGTCPLTLPTILYLIASFSVCGEVGCFFFGCGIFHLSLDLSACEIPLDPLSIKNELSMICSTICFLTTATDCSSIG